MRRTRTRIRRPLTVLLTTATLIVGLTAAIPSAWAAPALINSPPISGNIHFAPRLSGIDTYTIRIWMPKSMDPVTGEGQGIAPGRVSAQYYFTGPYHTAHPDTEPPEPDWIGPKTVIAGDSGGTWTVFGARRSIADPVFIVEPLKRKGVLHGPFFNDSHSRESHFWWPGCAVWINGRKMLFIPPRASYRDESTIFMYPCHSLAVNYDWQQGRVGNYL
ncbi:MAG: hypothetical protein QM662_07135 [Gordonia sp. (in: high G+C Gram-positive bacteria)]